jgi:hypothetical protein
MKILDVIVTDKLNGGLRRTSSSGFWFHSSTDQPYGYALNQHWFACRELARAAELLDMTDPAKASLYRTTAQRGIDQLFGSSFPNWESFKPAKSMTWAFYGHSGSGKNGYFLKPPANPHKNGGYHVKTMELVYSLVSRGYTVPKEGLPWLLRMYELKESLGLFSDHKPAEGGDFHGLVDEANRLLPAVRDWFKNLS